MDTKKKSPKPASEKEENTSNLDGFSDNPTFVTEVVEEVPEEEVADVDTDGQEESSSVGESANEEVLDRSDENEEDEIAEEKSSSDNGQEEELDDISDTASDTDESATQETFKKQKVEEIYRSKHTGALVDIALNKKNNSQPIIVWACIIVVVALMTGGGLLLIVNNTNGNKGPVVKPTPTMSQSISPTPIPVTLKREDLKVQVLNGGGKAGAGSKMKTLLTDLGYTVADVGNTKEYTFDKTEIEVKVGKEGAMELLRNDLAKDYSLGTVSASLSGDSLYDVRVTVGK